MATGSKWFQATNIDELKKEYRTLAKKHHPDTGGDTATMQAINAEYDKLFKLYNTDGKHDISDGYRAVIDKIIGLDGIEIEICGSWIWVSGDTKQHKDIFKAAGFWWASKKLMWYWRPEESKTKFHNKPVDMDRIRRSYGSEVIKTSSRDQKQQIA
jgi:hypothetical protein